MAERNTKSRVMVGKTTLMGPGINRGECGEQGPKRRENEHFADYQKRRALQNKRLKKYMAGSRFWVSMKPSWPKGRTLRLFARDGEGGRPKANTAKGSSPARPGKPLKDGFDKLRSALERLRQVRD